MKHSALLAVACILWVALVDRATCEDVTRNTVAQGAREAFVTIYNSPKDQTLLRVLYQSWLNLHGSTANERPFLVAYAPHSLSLKELAELRTLGMKTVNLGDWCPITEAWWHSLVADTRKSDEWLKIQSIACLWTAPFQRVVFLDVRTQVLANVNDLFTCGKLCATVRSTDTVSQSVMVISPDSDSFEYIQARINRAEGKHMPSIGGFDPVPQFFARTFYFFMECPWHYTALDERPERDFGDAPILNPSVQGAPSKLSDVPNALKDCRRISVNYNYDSDVYVKNSNKFVSPLGQPKIIHWSMKFMSPHYWYSQPFIYAIRMFDSVRETLPATSYDDAISSKVLWRGIFWPVVYLVGIVFALSKMRNGTDMSGVVRGMVNIMAAMPGMPHTTKQNWLRLVSNEADTSDLGNRPDSAASSGGRRRFDSTFVRNKLLPFASEDVITGIALAVAFTATGLAYSLAFWIVPLTAPSTTGWVLFFEWVVLLGMVCWFAFFAACYHLGRRHSKDSPRFIPLMYSGLKRRVVESILFFLLQLSWNIVLVYMWSGLGKEDMIFMEITASIAKHCLLQLVVMTYGFTRLSHAWYMCGLRLKDQSASLS